MDAMDNTHELAAAPLKPHASSASHIDDLTSALRHALREVSADDPDLLATIVGRSSVVGGKNKCKQEGQQAAPASSCGPGPAAEEEHDRSYFALLKKISQLEADNLRLENQVAMIKEDTMAYEEVARELEDDLNVVTAENSQNIATIAELKTTQGKSNDIAKRLVSAERTIVQLRAQLQTDDCEQDMIGLNKLVVAAQSTEACCAPLRRAATMFESSETILPPTALPEALAPLVLMEELDLMEDSQHVRARVTLGDITWRACEISDDCMLSRAIQHRPTKTESTSIADVNSDTEDVRVSTCHASVGLTYSLVRVHMQRAAVEYRLAVREHLQSVARQASQAVPRSCLADLFSTPRDILDDEVLSEDDGESDLCRSRMRLSGEFCNLSSRSMC